MSLALFALLFMTAACGGGGATDGGETASEGGDGGAADAPMESPVDPATAGTVSGTVAFTGTPPEQPVIDMSGEPDCASQYTDEPRQQHVVVGENGEATLANVFVYVKDGLGDLEFPVPSEPVVLDQQGCRYVPHVLGVQTDQKLVIRNSDPVLHNIHPQPSVNRPFNVSQPTQGMESEKTFPEREVMIPIGCDVHDWMNAHLGVMDHPYFAVTGDDGTFTLPNLPPGDYTIAAWHEEYGEQEQQVTVGPSGTAEVDFSYAGG
jgi:hypothetical protein